MKREDCKCVSDVEWVDANLIDFMENELNQEDMRRTMMALETTPKLRGRLNEYLLIKASLKSQHQIQQKRVDANLESLHKRIMTQIETSQLQKKK